MYPAVIAKNTLSEHSTKRHKNIVLLYTEINCLPESTKWYVFSFIYVGIVYLFGIRCLELCQAKDLDYFKSQ